MDFGSDNPISNRPSLSHHLSTFAMAPKAEKAPAKKVVAKKPAGDSIIKKKKRSSKSIETYKIYIYKVLKQVHPDTGISSKATNIFMAEFRSVEFRMCEPSMEACRVILSFLCRRQ
jgi:hypothetical protein